MRRLGILSTLVFLSLSGCGYGRAHDAAAPMVPGPSAMAAEQMPIEHDTESYDRVDENPFLSAAKNPLSTFSIDVDTASYSNVRRFLVQGSLPPKDAVRIEELVNYFPYEYSEPQGDAPFGVSTEVSEAPWNPEHRLVHIGLQGKRLAESEMPPRNLVF